jgi:aerobic C4-dicarboxylate transport protein
MSSSPVQPRTSTLPRLLRSLYFQVIVAIIAGVLLGLWLPETGAALKPLGDGFIKLVKMLIGPVIFCTVVLGIAGMEDMKKVGKVGGLALLYFEIVSTLALILGLVVVNLVKPGVGMIANPTAQEPALAVAPVATGHLPGITEFLLNVIPKTLLGAFVDGEVLQVLLIALLFGFALHRFGRDTALFGVIESGSRVLFVIVGYVMRLAPIGAFGAMAYTIGAHGVGTLASLGKLLLCFYATCVLFILGILGAIARLHGFRILRLIRYLKDELLIVLGTSSSESVLPRMLGRMEAVGVERSVVGLVIPTGYSFNLDGTSIYLTMAAIFIAQATNTPLDLSQQLTLLFVLLLTSKGAAAVTGSGFIVLTATLSAVGHVPVSGLALILGIDRFMSEARALTNLIGNGVATIVIGKWCGQVEEERLRQELGGRT